MHSTIYIDKMDIFYSYLVIIGLPANLNPPTVS